MYSTKTFVRSSQTSLSPRFRLLPQAKSQRLTLATMTLSQLAMLSSRLKRKEKVKVPRLLSLQTKLQRLSHWPPTTRFLCRTRSETKSTLHLQVIKRMKAARRRRLKLCQLQLSGTSPRRKASTSIRSLAQAKMVESPRLTFWLSLRVAMGRRRKGRPRKCRLKVQGQRVAMAILGQESRLLKASQRRMSM